MYEVKFDVLFSVSAETNYPPRKSCYVLYSRILNFKKVNALNIIKNILLYCELKNVSKMFQIIIFSCGSGSSALILMQQLAMHKHTVD
jgi:hypothetical protein